LATLSFPEFEHTCEAQIRATTLCFRCLRRLGN